MKDVLSQEFMHTYIYVHTYIRMLYYHTSIYSIYTLGYLRYIGATTVEAYFPKGSRWYDLFTDKIVSAAGGATMTLDSPIDHIPVS